MRRLIPSVGTEVANVRLLSSVDAHVPRQITLLHEGLVADRALRGRVPEALAQGESRRAPIPRGHPGHAGQVVRERRKACAGEQVMMVSPHRGCRLQEETRTVTACHGHLSPPLRGHLPSPPPHGIFCVPSVLRLTNTRS